METETSLRDKRFYRTVFSDNEGSPSYDEKDVREAVVRLKKKFNDAHFDKGIDEIFGDKLT